MPTPASTFSTLGLGSAPKVGAPTQGRPAPVQYLIRRPGTTLGGQLTMVTRAAIAPLPGPAAGKLSWNAVSWANFKSWFPSPKNRLSTPKHSQEPMGTLGGLHPGGIGGA